MSASKTNTTVAKNSKPILTDELLKMLVQGELDRTSVVPLGVNSEGVVITVAEFPRVQGRGRYRKLVPGTIHAYTILDLPTASGGFNISNVVSVLPQQTAVLTSGAGNTSFSQSTDILIKTMIITTAAGGSARLLKVATAAVSSKTVAPATTNGDLLDREVAVPKNSSVTIGNGVAGDTWVVSYLNLGV